ncbi:YncE family protein [Amycolatopsis alkalitolerans]|uniref:YncE family protein n=1 Tax=Amycolatopsis alkalitolerans TaxID=2547244 RepID=A0A5C4MAU8_9PSEU|nr:beta-propeller fold lactonase family protein [Amycolatopsis alkalitolerans]TNC29729.1 hypothetical protein FG385_01915 [Amycolatopsis alkalitolerans]
MDTAARGRRISVLLVIAAAVAMLVALTNPAAGDPAAARFGLAPRIYTVTPSSEPGAITGPSSVKVWDAGTNKMIKEVPVPSDRADGLSRPHHFMAIPGRNFAFVMGFAPTSSIKVFDMVKNEFTGEIQTGLGPRHLEFNPNGAVAYSANFDGDSISAININSRKTEATIPVGDRPNYVEYVKTKHGPRLFVCNFGENTVTVINADTYQVIGKVTVGDGPFNMSATLDNRFLVTADARSNTATFVDVDTLKVTDQIGIGGTHRTDLPPSAFQRLNPRISPDGKWLFIGNQDASAVSVINIRERRLEALIPAGLGADIAFFPGGPADGYALVTNRYDNFVTVVKLHGDEPPTFVKNIPTERIGSHYITFSEDWSKGIVSERPGRAYSVIDMAKLVETANVWVGGTPGPSEPDHSQDYTRAGPDMAVYVWFDKGKAMFHHE